MVALWLAGWWQGGWPGGLVGLGKGGWGNVTVFVDVRLVVQSICKGYVYSQGGE